MSLGGVPNVPAMIATILGATRAAAVETAVKRAAVRGCGVLLVSDEAAWSVEPSDLVPPGVIYDVNSRYASVDEESA